MANLRNDHVSRRTNVILISCKLRPPHTEMGFGANTKIAYATFLSACNYVKFNSRYLRKEVVIGEFYNM